MMTIPYLLGFVREYEESIFWGDKKANFTRLGKHAVLWSGWPSEVFPTKQEFLLAMLSLYEKVCSENIEFLPVQSGIRVSKEENLIDILRKYEVALEDGFNKVSGCYEYSLSLHLCEEEQRLRSSASENQSSDNEIRRGRDYFNKVRLRHKQREDLTQQMTQIIGMINKKLGQCYRDYFIGLTDVRIKPNTDSNKEFNLTLEIAYLVPIDLEQEFHKRIGNLINDNQWEVTLTGPWPPFHFSVVTLQSEGYIVRKSLSWEESTHDRK